MLTAAVARWAAWAPGLTTTADWARWCRDPRPVRADGIPPTSFLPSLLRRRCTRLTRMALEAAFGCGAPADLARMPTVFASRHGDTPSNVALLEALARGEPLSPTGFSHCVHNAPAALFAIAACNHLGSSSLAAAGATFPTAFLEASLVLRRRERVLLVVADEPLAVPLASFQDEPPMAYALALILVASDALAFRAAAEGEEESRVLRWPHALEFLRWLCSPVPTLTLGRWTWTRRR